MTEGLQKKAEVTKEGVSPTQTLGTKDNLPRLSVIPQHRLIRKRIKHHQVLGQRQLI